MVPVSVASRSPVDALKLVNLNKAPIARATFPEDTVNLVVHRILLNVELVLLTGVLHGQKESWRRINQSRNFGKWANHPVGTTSRFCVLRVCPRANGLRRRRIQIKKAFGAKSYSRPRREANPYSGNIFKNVATRIITATKRSARVAHGLFVDGLLGSCCERPRIGTQFTWRPYC